MVQEAPLDKLKTFAHSQGIDAVRRALLLEDCGELMFFRASEAFSWPEEKAKLYRETILRQREGGLTEALSPSLARYIYTKWMQVERQLRRIGKSSGGPDWPYIWTQVRLVLNAVVSSAKAKGGDDVQ